MEGFYVETPQGEVLQMCFMRPTAEQLCPSLPFLVPAPELSAAACGIEPMPMAAEHALPDRQPRQELEVASQQSSTGGSSLDIEEFFGRLARALLRRDEALPDASAAVPADWERALSGDKGDPVSAYLIEALRSPSHVHRLALAARSEALCDLLLQQCFPPLLRQEQATGDTDSGDLVAALARSPSVAASALASGPEASLAPGPAQPLPPPLSELLVQLLQSGSMLRLELCEYDRRVVVPLDAAGGLGPRAAAQATLVYAASRATAPQE